MLTYAQRFAGNAKGCTAVSQNPFQLVTSMKFCPFLTVFFYNLGSAAASQWPAAVKPFNIQVGVTLRHVTVRVQCCL